MFIFSADPSHGNESEEKAFQRSFHSREDRFRFGMERGDVNRSDSREISSRNIGEKLVSNHDGLLFIPLITFEYSPAAVRQRFEGHCFVGQLGLFCDPSDSLLFAVGEKADLNVRLFQRMKPFEDPSLKNVRVVAFKRAVDVQQNVFDIQLLQNVGSEFVHDIHFVAREKWPKEEPNQKWITVFHGGFFLK